VLKEGLADAACGLEFPISSEKPPILFSARSASPVGKADQLRRWSRVKKHLKSSGENAGL
jgi:hypothetical protein